MLAKINTTHSTMPPEKAEAMAAKLNGERGSNPDWGDVDDWTYKVKHDPKGTGGSIIQIFDETGAFVGLL